MKKQYESPEFDYFKVLLPEDVLTVSEDQGTGSEIGGGGPGDGGFDGPDF